ncbi:hypothetical protein [Rhodococcus sp. NPDC004095]
MKTNPTPAAVGLAAVVVLGLSACSSGGEDSNASESVPPMPAAESTPADMHATGS